MYQRYGGSLRWNAVDVCTTTTRWPIARQHSRHVLVRHLSDSQFPSEHWCNTFRWKRKKGGRSTCSGEKNVEERLARRHTDCRYDEDLQATEAAEIHVRRFEQKHVFCERTFRISVLKRRVATSWSTQTISFQRQGTTHKETMMKSKKAVIFLFRHHQEPQLKMSDPDNETFLSPLKYVDVMRRTDTSMNNVSETLSMTCGPKLKYVNLTEEWTGITRFQIPRARLLDGYKRVNVNGRLAKIHQTRHYLAGSSDANF